LSVRARLICAPWLAVPLEEVQTVTVDIVGSAAHGLTEARERARAALECALELNVQPTQSPHLVARLPGRFRPQYCLTRTGVT
jgi:hypothetical protein